MNRWRSGSGSRRVHSTKVTSAKAKGLPGTEVPGMVGACHGIDGESDRPGSRRVVLRIQMQVKVEERLGTRRPNEGDARSPQ